MATAMYKAKDGTGKTCLVVVPLFAIAKFSTDDGKTFTEQPRGEFFKTWEPTLRQARLNEDTGAQREAASPEAIALLHKKVDALSASLADQAKTQAEINEMISGIHAAVTGTADK